MPEGGLVSKDMQQSQSFFAILNIVFIFMERLLDGDYIWSS